MIYIKKKNKAKLLVILSVVMAVLIAGYFLLVALLPEKGGEEAAPKYEQLPWEASGQRVFPDIDTTLVDYITLNVTAGMEHASYGFMEADDGAYSLWYYPDKNSKKLMEYNPSIVSKDPSFSYSSLYATDSFGQGTVARLYYLRVAITTMYFSERISLEGLTESERMSYEEEFGFMNYGDRSTDKDDKQLGVIVNYGKIGEDGKNEDFHQIWIGGQNVSKNGYYVKIDGKPYIYATKNSQIGYALQPYTYYINPAVISAGLASDAAYEPYLISDYRQWKNEVVYENDDKNYPVIPEDAQVIVRGEVSLPADPSKGGLLTMEESTDFHLRELKDVSQYRRLIEILKKQKLTGVERDEDGNIQSYPTLADSLYITLVTEGRLLSFAKDKTTLTQEYEILEILSAITEDGERVSGVVSSDATAIRVRYNLYKDGSKEKSNEKDLYGVISLSDSRLPSAWVEAIRGLTVGVSLENVNVSRLEVLFDQENAQKLHKKEIEIYLADIIAIFDKNGKATAKITEDSYVSYRYYLVVNGQKREEYYTAMDKVADMNAENRDLFLEIGAKGEDLDKKIGAYTEYFDIVQDYISYKIDAIPYMVVSEEIVHFKFLNYSQRDPFYGESIYDNLLEDERALYGLNNSACENVLLHLGGAGQSTQTSNGYAGVETVAVGLTPEIMMQYGLYANTIYYELPRGIGGLDGNEAADDDELDDYTWKSTLGFTVYLSDKRADGSRYMASNLYDVVVLVRDEKLDFVDFSFVDFWARRLLVSMDIDDLAKLDVEFNFADKKGDFGFRLHTISLGEGKERVLLLVTPGAVTFDNALVNFMKQNDNAPDGTKEQSLGLFFNKVGPEKYYDAESGWSHIGNDYTGTYFFKELLGIMYSTMYVDTYTEAEQEEILKSEYLARLCFTLKNQSYKYVYEFYRASDRRVLVKIYQESPSGERTGYVADFAISTATFKKIMGGYEAILNAKEVSGDAPYFD